jgi:hypothetical protein
LRSVAAMDSAIGVAVRAAIRAAIGAAIRTAIRAAGAHPAVKPLGRTVPPAEPEGERQSQRDRRHQDQERLPDHIAEPELVEGDEHDEDQHRIGREATEQSGIAHAGLAEVGGGREPDEAREVRPEGQQQHGHHDPRHEQQHAADELGHVLQVQAVEGDHQRDEDDQPVHQQAEDLHGVDLAAALAQERVEAGLFADHVEVHRAQRAVDRETRRLRQQPADQQDDDGQQQARQERAELIQQGTYGFQDYIDISHGLPHCLRDGRFTPGAVRPVRPAVFRPSRAGCLPRSSVRTAASRA